MVNKYKKRIIVICTRCLGQLMFDGNEQLCVQCGYRPNTVITNLDKVVAPENMTFTQHTILWSKYC